MDNFTVKCVENTYGKGSLYFLKGKEYEVTMGILHCTIGFPQVNSDLYITDTKFNNVEEINSEFENESYDTRFELVKENRDTTRICPFDNTEIHTQHFTNTVCPVCNAKYYINTGKWLKR